jgi:hypothetical protein
VSAGESQILRGPGNSRSGIVGSWGGVVGHGFRERRAIALCLDLTHQTPELHTFISSFCPVPRLILTVARPSVILLGSARFCLFRAALDVGSPPTSRNGCRKRPAVSISPYKGGCAPG